MLKINKRGDTIRYQYSQHINNKVYYRCRIFSCLIACMALMNKDMTLDGMKKFLDYCEKELKIDPNKGQKAVDGAVIVKKYWNELYPNNKVDYVTGNIKDDHIRMGLGRGLPIVASFFVSDKYRQDMNRGRLTAMDYSTSPDWSRLSMGTKLPLHYRPFLKEVSAHAMCIQNIEGIGYAALDSTSTGEIYYIPGGWKRLSSVKNFFMPMRENPIVMFKPM